MAKQIPQEWADAMVRCGFTHQGKPSMAALGRAAGLSTEAVRRIIYGISAPLPENVAKVSAALRGAPVEEWVGVKRELGELYTPPESSRYLTRRQRVAVTELINSITVEAMRSDEAAPEQPTASFNPSGYTLAARRGRSQGKQLRSDSEDYNQDPGGCEPA